MQKQVKRVVRNVAPHWVGNGFPVRSLFSYGEGSEYDPFLLLDYAGPYEFGPGEAKRGVGEHPHRGFETVTILYEGELEHRDSSGSHGTIGPGDVQWMTAASGIVHEEFHSRGFSQQGGTLEMVQLWVNLPASAKKLPPKYQDLRAAQFPSVSLPDVSGNATAGTARVVAGQLLGTSGPASTFTPINLWDLQLSAGGQTELSIPSGHTSLLVVQSGQVMVGSEIVKGGELALFETEGTVVKLAAEASCRILVLTGEPIREPVVGQGPFVMNTQEEIQQAITDYRAGKMGSLASLDQGN